jgi:hypothetical protein
MHTHKFMSVITEANTEDFPVCVIGIQLRNSLIRRRFSLREFLERNKLQNKEADCAVRILLV